MAGLPRGEVLIAAVCLARLGRDEARRSAMRAARLRWRWPKLHKNRAVSVETLISHDRSLFESSQGWRISGQNRGDIRQKRVIAITDALFVESAESIDAILAPTPWGVLAAK
jgi:hypothetical protein